MRIPTGHFGFRHAEPEPLVDVRAPFEAVAQVADTVRRGREETLERRRRQDEAIARQRASNRLLDEGASADELLAQVRAKLEAGELVDEQAREWLEQQFDARPADAPEGLDPVALEQFTHGIGITRRRAHGKLGDLIDKRRGDRLLSETTRGLEVLKRQAGIPGADVAEVNARVMALKPSLLAAGVPADVADGKLAEVAATNWTNEVERRLTDARNDSAALALLGYDLSAAEGFYLDKLDVDRRNALHRSVVMRQDALADEAARLARERRRELEEDAAREAIENVLLTGGRLDYTDKDHRGFVDDLFTSRARDLGLDQPSLAVAPLVNEAAALERSGQLAHLGIAVASRTGIVPGQLERLIRVGVRTPTPIVAQLAADAYARLKVTAPELTAQVDPDTRAFSELVAVMLDAGAPPARAVETARAQTFDAKPEVIEQRRAAWRGKDGVAAGQKGALEDLVDRDFDPGLFSFEPAITERLRADFDAQTERYFLKVGDPDLARDLAWEDMRRIYGETSVNGRRELSLFPVERFGVKPEEVRKDLEKAGIADADTVMVVPDSLTLRAVNEALTGRPISPTYRLVTQAGDLVLDAQGQPLRYALPGGEELTRRLQAERDAAIERGAKNVEEVRASRERRRRLERERLELEARERNARAFPIGLGGP